MNAQHTTQALNKAGWSDTAIAHACGCSQPTITRIRNGKSNPRESTLRPLEKLLQQINIAPNTPQDG